MTKKKKISLLQFSLVFLIISIIFIVIVYFSEKVNEKYKNKGIEINAEITKRYSKTKTGKTFAKDYYIDVYFFPKAKKNNDTIIDVTDENFYKKNIGNITKPISAKISITEKNYKNLLNTDSVAILYLPDNPSNARLKKNVENFNIDFGYYISAVIFIIAIVIFFIHQKKKKNNRTN